MADRVVDRVVEQRVEPMVERAVDGTCVIFVMNIVISREETVRVWMWHL